MKWYHNVLCHPGGVRMDCTMRSVYTWLNMREDIYEFRKTCPMVDPVTGWFEYAQLYEPPTAKICKELFESTWLSRYPRPKEIGIGNGSEFQKEINQLA